MICRAIPRDGDAVAFAMRQQGVDDINSVCRVALAAEASATELAPQIVDVCALREAAARGESIVLTSSPTDVSWTAGGAAGEHSGSGHDIGHGASLRLVVTLTLPNLIEAAAAAAAQETAVRAEAREVVAREADAR